jgi:hypothetical protein
MVLGVKEAGQHPETGLPLCMRANRRRQVHGQARIRPRQRRHRILALHRGVRTAPGRTLRHQGGSKGQGGRLDRGLQHQAAALRLPDDAPSTLRAGTNGRGGSPDMPAPLPPSTIGRCPASSRSFPRGPDGPARAPPGQDLRSGALIGLPENREQNKIRITRSPRFEGNPGSRRAGDGSCPRRRCLIAARRAVSLAELLLPAAGGSGGGTAGYGFQPGWRVRAGGGTVSVPLILFTRRVRAAVSALACSLLPWTCCARAGPGG